MLESEGVTRGRLRVTGDLREDRGREFSEAKDDLPEPFVSAGSGGPKRRSTVQAGCS